MPEASGIDLAKSLGELNTPKCILMISSLASENIIIDSISNGANDFLKKPFEPVDLVRSVEKLMLFAHQEKII